MSYYVMITRQKSWDDGEGPSIELPEWQNIVASDPDLELSGALSRNEATWHDTASDSALFLLWSEGNILAKSPNPSQLRKMAQIAEVLRARVIGESDEIYTADNIDQVFLETFGEVVSVEQKFQNQYGASEPENSFSIERVLKLLFLLILLALPSALVKCSAEQKKRAEEKRAEEEKLDRSLEEIRQAVRDGKAGPAFRRLFQADDPRHGKRD